MTSTMGGLFSGPTMGDFNGPLLGSGPTESTESGDWTPSRPVTHWTGGGALTRWAGSDLIAHWAAGNVRQQ